MQWVSTLVVVIVGAAMLRWYDAFHLAVALPVIGSAALLRHWIVTAARPEGDDVDPDDEDPIVVRTLRGALAGVALLIVVAGGLFVAARSPVYGFFYDRDLAKLL